MSSDALKVLLGELDRQERNDSHDDRVRLAVRLRARDACEYCLLPTIGQFHVDHIIPSSRWDDFLRDDLVEFQLEFDKGSPEQLRNFAWACSSCNIAKGEQVGRRIGRSNYRLFHPRLDHWEEHFVFVHSYLLIVGTTLLGVATERALQLNDNRHNGHLGTRHDSILLGRYPPTWAQGWSGDAEDR